MNRFKGQQLFAEIKSKPEWLALGVFALVAGALRLLSPIDNFAPMAGFAVCCGIFAGNRLIASSLPLVVVMITDYFMTGFYPGIAYVYGSYVAIALVAGMAKRFALLPTIPLFGLASSVIFFAISNFGVWVVGSGNFYPHSLEGLIACYVAGAPFFKISIIGDVLFSSIGFVAMRLALTKNMVSAKA